MVKEIHLTYNLFGDRYFFTEKSNPADPKGRKELKTNSGLLKKLGSLIDSRRISVLHLYDVPEEVRNEIVEAYDGTKVFIDIARDRKLN